VADPVEPVTPAKLKLMTDAATAACDSADGVRDRIVTDPMACRFDPGVLTCKAGDRSDCLTPRQVTWARQIYRGIRDPKTDEQIFPGPLPTSEVDWVVEKTHGDTTAGHVRLFMAPGVHHCAGGEGAWQVDFLSVLEEWVERGKAPDRITASRPLEGGRTRTRPLCPYPQVATYAGEGNSDDARSFVCTSPAR
jgi:hypothetical protein